MVEKVKRIKIRGGRFDRETTFELFNDEKVRATIVYGENGSGKTTIARGFRKIIDDSYEENGNEVESALLLNNDNQEINNEIKDKIVVFDEKYVNDNVGFLIDDGLKAITLIGRQNQYQKEIDKIIEEKSSFLVELKKSETDLEKKNNDIEIFKNKAKAVLTRTDGFRDRERFIRENNSITKVDDKLNQILGRQVDEKEKDIENKYEDLKERFRKSKDPNIKLSKISDELGNQIPNKDDVEKLISQIIKKPNSDSKLSELINKNIDKLDETKVIFQKEEYCPYCYQSIKTDYKNNVLEIIKSIQNNEVDDYKKELEKIKIKSRNTIENIDSYEIINSELTKIIKMIINDCNAYIEKYNNMIDYRKKNPFIEFDKKDELLKIYNEIESKVNEYNNSVNKINEKIVEIEKDKKDKKELQEKLIECNLKLAYFDIFNDNDCRNIFGNLKAYSDNIKEIEDLERKKEDFKKNEKECDEKILKYESEKKNVKIACDKMNEYLNSIFYSKDRIKIVVENNTYVLKVNGRDVKPKNVSTGERNIIALCYFFLNIMDGDNEDELYKKERLYVIDDPVSSFDYGNRIGIMSFLRLQYDVIIKKNDKSRILIFSHDIFAIQDTIKSFIDIYGKGKYDDIKSKILLFEIKNNKFEKFKNGKINLYESLLEDVFQYADNDVSDDSGIGNKMRRLLESFATFSYGKGINEISQNDEILELIKEDKVREFYRIFMHRLVLNSESHTEDITKNLVGNDNNWPMVSEEEKRKTAKHILALMYLLNPKHIEFKLNDEEKINKIKEWINEIKNIVNQN